MDYDSELEYLKEEILVSSRKIDFLSEQLLSAREFTQKFLDKCGDAGITKVSVRRRHKSVPASVEFPFGPGHSVFSFVPKRNKNGGWPPIWGVVKELEISGGAGNTDQHQISGDSLIDGVYHLKAGKWIRVD